MEERYGQLEIDAGNVRRTESSQDQQEREKRTYQKNPYTYQIDEQLLRNEEEDEGDLISPDQKVFKSISDKLRKNDDNIIPYSAWNRNDDSGNVEQPFDDTYANTAETQHNFMKTFGFVDTRKNRSLEETNPSTAEIEALQGDIHSDYYEYTDRQQRKEIIGMYKYAKKSISIKLICASVFAFMLLLIENIAFFSESLYNNLGIADRPYMFFLIDIFLLLGCAAFAYEQLFYGARSILAKEQIPESISVYALVVGIAYSLITLIFVPFGFEQKHCNFPVALILVFSLLYSYLNVVREKYGFSVVSSKDTKFVFTKVANDDAEAEYETFSTTSVNYSGNIIKIDKANFVRRYFARTNESAEVRPVLDPYVLASLIAPIVLFIISIIRTHSFTDALSVWYVGFLISLPVGFLFNYSVPFLMGNKRLFNDEVAIIGEGTVDEYSDIKIISVNDTTAFPPYNVKLQNLKVYNGHKIEKILYYAASGFSAVGGPLAEVFDVATRDAFQRSKRTRFVCSGRSYLCVKVDNDTIIFADRYGIASQGIEVPNEREEHNEEISVMYMACNGQLCAKMYINYMIDEDFAITVRSLNKHGTSVGIRTFDPNINNEIIKKQTIFRKSELCVIKLNREDQMPKVEDKVDSGIASKGASKSLLKAIPVCKNITKIRKANLVVKIVASLVGLLLLGFAVFDKISMLASILVGFFYVPWMLIMLAITAIYLSRVK